MFFLYTRLFDFPDLTTDETESKQKRDLSWIRPQKADDKGQLCIVMKPVERVTGMVSFFPNAMSHNC